jgi:NADH-quinone oxidoreductase subunit N
VILQILPEIFCFIISVVFLMMSFGKPRHENLYRMGMLFCFVNILIVAFTLQMSGLFFYESYKIDLFSQSVKLLLCIGLFFVVFMTDSRSDEHIKKNFPEFMFFLLTGNLGMMMLVSSVEFISLFLSLELSSYSMFILTGFLRDKKVSAEAGIKYLFIGAVASAITLYGYSLLFGYFTDTSLFVMKNAVGTVLKDAVLYIGFIFFLAAFFFKLAILPFSFWAPDVYEGADTSVVTYIATVSKVAGFAVLLRIFIYFIPVFADMEKMLLLVAVMTMTMGNLLAVQQKDIKRLLAYSSIAQAGYMMVGVTMMNESGASGTLFYVFAYLIMNFTVFLVADQLIKEKGSTSITVLKGLSQRSPLLAMALLLALLSLGGVPPFVGFTGKWFIFSAAINKGYLLLVLFAFLNSVVSVYYYLLVARQAYVLLPDDTKPLEVPLSIRAYSYFAVIFIMAMGIYPTAMLGWTEKAVRFLFAG